MSNNDIKLQQESFFIDQLKFSKNKKIVRQDRWIVEPGIAFLKNEKEQFEILNMSPFGIAILVSNQKIEQDEVSLNNSYFKDYKIIYKSIETQQVTLKVVRIENTIHLDSDFTILGLEVTGETIKIERCKALDTAFEIIKEQELNILNSSKIPKEFKAIVYEMKDWLSNLKVKIDEAEKKAPIDNARENEEYKLTISDTISEFLGITMPPIYENIKIVLNSLDSETKKQCTEFMRSQIGSYVYKAPFASRAYFKPRGYAGDYEMMNHLYRNEMVGETLFDQCLHKYFIDEPAGNAVKNRGEYLFQKIKQMVSKRKNTDSIKILSIASGPAMEMQLFIKNCPEFHNYDITFYCIDQDEESLKHAQRELLSINRLFKTNFKFNFSNLAIKNIIAQGVPSNGFDLIYSAGLFDYFTDPVATIAANKMYEAIKPGGTVIIGNFSKDNPNITLMEIVLDWILLYRSEEDLHRIFKGIGCSCHVEFEPLKINLFAVIE